MRSREQQTTTDTTVRAALLNTPTSDFDKLVIPINPITEPAAAAAVDLDADRAAFPGGLSSAEAARRLQRFGPNALPEEEKQEWRVLLSKVGYLPLLPLLLVLVLSRTLQLDHDSLPTRRLPSHTSLLVVLLAARLHVLL